jgi:hypothetical protein
MQEWKQMSIDEQLPIEPSLPLDELTSIGGDEFSVAFGESLANTLDLHTWQPGENLANLYGRLEQEIEQAVEQESRIRDRIRSEVFPRLLTRKGAPKGAGVYQVLPHHVEKVHRGLLFNGQVEACDGTSVPFDTLPISIVQIGVCLVSYRGDQGSWVHRLYRRDLRVGGLDPVQEAVELLNERQKRSGYDQGSKRDALSDLARRGIMSYAERAVLMKMAKSPWRMGHGSPAPYELLTGSGMEELLERSLILLNELVDHEKFIFIPSSPNDRMLLTIGNALRPLEYAIVDTLEDSITRLVERGHYRGDWAGLVGGVKDFARKQGPRIVKGAFRATALAPAQVFYAHIEHAHEAALIAMSDSVLQDSRGFPMLIDLADTLCGATFGRETLTSSTQMAYAEAGEPLQYLTERQTRR